MRLLRNQHVTTFAVGVGQFINRRELLSIAGSQDRVFTVNNFKLLQRIVKKIQFGIQSLEGIRKNAFCVSHVSNLCMSFINYSYDDHSHLHLHLKRNLEYVYRYQKYSHGSTSSPLLMKIMLASFRTQAWPSNSFKTIITGFKLYHLLIRGKRPERNERIISMSNRDFI